MTNLSKNFTLDELTTSDTAERLGISNKPDSIALDSLEQLAQKVLQPIRDQFGVVDINSGYRCPALNKAIGGASQSQHIFGEAADITCRAVDIFHLAQWIKDNLIFDQLILEPTWVHVSYKRQGNRRQVLTAKRTNAGMVYKNGLQK